MPAAAKRLCWALPVCSPKPGQDTRGPHKAPPRAGSFQPCPWTFGLSRLGVNEPQQVPELELGLTRKEFGRTCGLTTMAPRLCSDLSNDALRGDTPVASGTSAWPAFAQMLNFHSDPVPELAGPDKIKPKHLGGTGAQTGEGIGLKSADQWKRSGS